jgi:hypothetical protein
VLPDSFAFPVMTMFDDFDRRLVRIACLVSSVWLAGLTSVRAQSYLAPLTPAVIGSILETYYQGPLAEHVPAIIQSALAQTAADDRAKRLTLIGFMAGLIADDATVINRLVPVFDKLPGDQPMQLVRAVLYSGRPDGAHHIAALKARWPTRADAIDTIAAAGNKAVYQLKFAGQPEVLAMNWAFFGATGRKEPVLAMIAALADLRQTTDPERLAVAQTVRRSLALRAADDERVKDLCRQALWGSYGDDLRPVLAAAEARDLSLLDAQAAPLAATVRSQRR